MADEEPTAIIQQLREAYGRQRQSAESVTTLAGMSELDIAFYKGKAAGILQATESLNFFEGRGAGAQEPPVCKTCQGSGFVAYMTHASGAEGEGCPDCEPTDIGAPGDGQEPHPEKILTLKETFALADTIVRDALNGPYLQQLARALLHFDGEIHYGCHDLVCNGDRSKPRGTKGLCSCRSREKREVGDGQALARLRARLIEAVDAYRDVLGQSSSLEHPWVDNFHRAQDRLTTAACNWRAALGGSAALPAQQEKDQ